MTRTLRSLMIGDCDHYQSPYMHGVKEAMARLGHNHREISIRQPIDVIDRVATEVQPDLLWTHMYLWGPLGSPPRDQLITLAEKSARRGCKIVLHDGDYKEPTRHATDISSWCSVALCNHKFDRSRWNVPILYWPYFAFIQDGLAFPVEQWKCDLFFAGSIQHDHTYSARTRLLEDIIARGVRLRIPTAAEGNTLLKTPQVAASADAVLGFGRPGVTGWADVRIFQYTGAGGILLHDDVVGFLEPWIHYVPYESGNTENIIEQLGRLKAMSDVEKMRIRLAALSYVQEKHSSLARVKQVLDFLFGEAS